LDAVVKIFLIAALSSLALHAADRSVTYRCASGESFQVIYQRKETRAVLVIAQKPRLTLTRAGNQYSDGFTVLTVRGPEASIAAGSVNFTNCLDMAAKSTPQANLSGKWTLAALGGQRVTLPRPAFIEFQADGGAAGLAGCNRFHSGFVSSGSSLRFEGAAVTRMACIGDAMQVEEEFLRAMNQTASYTVSGTTLTLRNAAGQALATLTKD
jgi:heat shock protein HslJ